MSIRIGQGFDVHAFGEGNQVIIGGVSIPHDRGLIAHSDGDVLLHALCDALLGAAGMGDIGELFPDTAPEWKNADSRDLLREVYRRLHYADWALINADCTVIAEAPKIGPHKQAMRANIARDLHVPPERINIKATTTEKLGFTGRDEGIAAQAVVLLAERM